MTREFEIKERAIELRKLGKGYNEISSTLGVAKSTLSLWFRDFVGEADIKAQNIDRNRKESKDRLFEFTEGRKKMLFLRYEKALEEAHSEFQNFKSDPLFIAGLMLYAGEGDNKTRCHIRISNTDWRLHAIFIKFAEKYLSYSREKIHCQLLAYPDLSQDAVKDFWSNKLGISSKNFHKTQIIQGKSKRRLQFGVCMTIINNTRMKYKLLEWISLFKDQYAGLV